MALVLYLLFAPGMPQAHAGSSTKVVVGVPPYAYLAEQIGGEYVQVKVLLSAGQDPHTFEPSPKGIMALGGARIFFSGGMEFEKHLIARIQDNFEGLKVVNLTEGLSLETPDHDLGHDHDHDPHTWLSPAILIGQAEIMARELAESDPRHSSVYHQNYLALQTTIRQARARIAKKLAPFRGRSFLVYHPAFGYFGKDFGLRQISVEANGSQPSPKQLGALLARAKEEAVKIIFVQPQFDQASAEILATSIGGAVFTMDPLAKDVIKNFSSMAEKLEKALQ